MVFIGNLLLVACALLAVVSVCEEILRLGFRDFGWLAGRLGFGVVCMALAIPVIVLCAMSPRLPARVVLPSALGAVWLGLGALPVALVVEPDHVGPAASAIFTGCVAFSFAVLRLDPAGAGRWWITRRDLPAFSLRRTLVFGALGLLLTPIAAGAYVVMALIAWTEQATGHFIDVHPGGVSIEERTYARDGREIHLVGMMHIGERDAYDALFESFAGASTLVLEEGVTDREGLLSTPLALSKVASAVGLQPQESVSSFFEEDGQPVDDVELPTVRRADLDISDFSPVTIDFLERAAIAWQQEGALGLAQAILDSSVATEDAEAVLDDLIWARNEVVLLELENGLDSFERIVVPWGAMHMPGIAQEVESLGFTTVSTRHRLLFSWSTLLARWSEE